MYEIFPFLHSREIEGSQEEAYENELIREEEVMLSSFPPAVASACPVWDRFHVTGEASVVAASREIKEKGICSCKCGGIQGVVEAE